MQVPIDRFESWLENKNLKPRTIENYLYYFNKFLSFGVFDQDSVSLFMSKKSNRNTIARSFLLNYQKFLLTNSDVLNISAELKLKIASVELPKITGRKKKRLPKAISKEEITRIESEFDNEFDKIKLLFSYYCGLRLGGLLKVRIVSFDWEKWKTDITNMGECRVFEKGDKEGIALVPAWLMKRIANLINSNYFDDPSSFLFVSPGKEYNFSAMARDWQKKLAAAAISAGVMQIDKSGKTVPGTSVHPHRLRHAYAIHLHIDLGMDIRKIQELLRHSDISSTQIYTEVNKENLKSEIGDRL